MPCPFSNNLCNWQNYDIQPNVDDNLLVDSMLNLEFQKLSVNLWREGIFIEKLKYCIYQFTIHIHTHIHTFSQLF